MTCTICGINPNLICLSLCDRVMCFSHWILFDEEANEMNAFAKYGKFFFFLVRSNSTWVIWFEIDKVRTICLGTLWRILYSKKKIRVSYVLKYLLWSFDVNSSRYPKVNPTECPKMYLGIPAWLEGSVWTQCVPYGTLWVSDSVCAFCNTHVSVQRIRVLSLPSRVEYT